MGKAPKKRGHQVLIMSRLAPSNIKIQGRELIADHGSSTVQMLAWCASPVGPELPPTVSPLSLALNLRMTASAWASRCCRGLMFGLAMPVLKPLCLFSGLPAPASSDTSQLNHLGQWACKYTLVFCKFCVECYAGFALAEHQHHVQLASEGNASSHCSLFKRPKKVVQVLGQVFVSLQLIAVTEP